MEQLYIDLKYRDQLILNKIKTYQLREGEIQNKRLVLEKLIQDSNLTQSNFELLINENTPLDLNFFEALESLDKLHSLQDSLNKCILIIIIIKKILSFHENYHLNSGLR